MATARTTITDVARRAGVSKSLVSFALNDRPGVSAQTRARILATADELGWRPSQRARSLSVSRAFALGLVVARPPEVLGADPFFPSFIAGVEAVLSTHDQALVIMVARDRAAELAGYERLSRNGRVDGVFLTDLRTNDSRPALLQRLGLAAVTLNRPPGGSRLPSVNLDDQPGVEQAVAHLVGLGHTRIGHVAGPPDLLHSRSRQGAWARALTAGGLPPGPVETGDFTAVGAGEATRRLLGLRRPPTAVVYASDLMAAAGMAVAREAGLRVPEDLSVTGFDDSSLARWTHPALTTVAVDTVGWGSACARALLALVEDGSADDVVLPPARLVVRRTTGAPPGPP